MPAPTSPRRRGFTLLELLISIAIIGLLAGITFPWLASSRRRARATTCISNMHQIGLALQMYAGDWDGCTPPYTTFPLDTFMIGDGETPTIIDITPFTDRRKLKACFAPYDAHYDELWRCPLHTDDPFHEDYEPETTYRMSPIFATQRPVTLDAPPTVSVTAYDDMCTEERQPFIFYWVDSDDVLMPIPNYLRCLSKRKTDGLTGTVSTPPHGKTYPMLLLDGSVVQGSAASAVLPSGRTLSW